MPSLGARERFADTLPMRAGARRAAFRPVDYGRQMLGTAAFFLLGLLVSVACWMLWKLGGRWISQERGQRLLQRSYRGYVELLRALGCLELRVEGQDVLRELEGTIIASNHPGLLDAIFICAYQPRTACVMRASLLRSPVLFGGSMLGGYVTNDLGSAFVRQGVEKIRAGGNLLIFPEGTRTRNHAVNAFKSGFALVAVKAGAPVQTILIEREGTYLSKGATLFAPVPMPLRVTIRPGERFVPQPGETARELTTRIETYFRSRLHNSGHAICLQPSVKS